MEKINDGGPAFPCVDAKGFVSEGMSLRDWLIGQALAGLCSNLASYEEHTKEQRAEFAIMQADETLELLKGGFNDE